MTTTLYGILLTATGLSHREAATLHGVRLDTIRSWSIGRNPANDGVIRDLVKIIENIQRGVDEIHAQACKCAMQDRVLDLRIAVDDAEAKALGWPTASSHARSVAMVAAQAVYLGAKVRILAAVGELNHSDIVDL